MSYGTVPDGEAIPAHPGELPCKMLIHAVGPKWSGGSLDEEYLLSAAISKCLELTDKYKFSSIAIPALSAGYFGCPAEKSAMSILRAIELYMKYVFSSIKEIYFCDVDDIIVKEFVKCLKKKFGLQVKELSGVEHGLPFNNFLNSFTKFYCKLSLYKIEFNATIFLTFICMIKNYNSNVTVYMHIKIICHDLP